MSSSVFGVVTTSFPHTDLDPAGRFVHTHVAQQVAKTGAQADVVAVGSGCSHLRESWGSLSRVVSRGLFVGPGAPETWEAAMGFVRLALGVEAVRLTLALAHEVRVRSSTWTEVQSHWLVPSAVATALAAPGLRHTAFAHSGDVACLESAPAGAALLRWLLPRLSRVVCVSEHLANRVRRLAGTAWPRGLPLEVQPMPVDGHVFRASAGVTRRSGILAVGRLVPIKGFDSLLLAVGGLGSQERPDVTILGEGPQRPRLSWLARRLGLTVSMPGIVAPSGVAQALGKARVCVIPSRQLRSGRTEGFPVIVGESLGCGTPVVASRVGGLSDLEGRPGVTLVAPEDVLALRRALHGYSGA